MRKNNKYSKEGFNAATQKRLHRLDNLMAVALGMCATGFAAAVVILIISLVS